MGPFVPRHNKWPRDETREIVVGGRVRLISRFTFQGNTAPEWDYRFGVVGDIGDVIEITDEWINVRWPNGSDPTFLSHVDRTCVEAYDGPAPSDWEFEEDVEDDDWEEIVDWSSPTSTPLNEIIDAARRIRTRPTFAEWRREQEHQLREPRTTELIRNMMATLRIDEGWQGPPTIRGAFLDEETLSIDDDDGDTYDEEVF